MEEIEEIGTGVESEMNLLILASRADPNLQKAVRAVDEKLRDLVADNARLSESLSEHISWRNKVSADGCKCDPPGSGEEWCVGTCYANVENARLVAEIKDLINKAGPFVAACFKLRELY